MSSVTVDASDAAYFHEAFALANLQPELLVDMVTGGGFLRGVLCAEIE